MKKPYWFNKKINLSEDSKMKTMLRGLKLHTVCEESLCPNISECFNNKVATFMILGSICTRKCSFCSVSRGETKTVDYNEPKRISQAVAKLNLKYVVITSPTRDDLSDCGLEIYLKTVKEIKNLSSSIVVELLIPDFLARVDLLKEIATCGADVISHNLETCPSLYKEVRKGANYQRSLEVLSIIKQVSKGIYTKSGLILGLGEKTQEIKEVLGDLDKVNCDFITIGQYLPPSLKHYPLKEYIHPEKFDFYKNEANKLGFKGVMSQPYVRSSYLAHSFYESRLFLV